MPREGGHKETGCFSELRPLPQIGFSGVLVALWWAVNEAFHLVGVCLNGEASTRCMCPDAIANQLEKI